MRRAVLLLFLLSSLTLAATPEEFVQPFLDPGEYSNSRAAQYGGQQYYVVWVNATPTFVLKQIGESYVFINDTSTIHAVLLRDFLNTVDVGGEISSLNSSLSSFQSQREPREHDCEILTGTDHLPCYDENTCLQACLSVPACRANNQGSGGEFVNEMLRWRQQNAMLDGNITLYQGNLSIVAQRGDQMDLAASSMETLLGRFYPPITQITTVNKLFRFCPDCFNYCYPIPFNTTLLSGSNSSIQQLRAKLAPIAGFASVADSVRRQTIVRTERSRFTLMLMKMEDATRNLTQWAAPVLVRIRDDGVSHGLSRINTIYNQVRAYGEAENYEPAFLLEPEFDAAAAPIAPRLIELQFILARYDGLMARVSADLFNATANSNSALRMINDTELNITIGKMRNISAQMQLLANQSNYSGAFELEDDYFWESGKANEEIINITVEYSAVIRAQNGAASLLNSTGAKLRPDDPELRGRYQNLSARYSLVLGQMAPPLSPSDVPQIRTNLASISEEAVSLSQLIDRTHKIMDRRATYSQTENLLKRLFFAWQMPW